MAVRQDDDAVDVFRDLLHAVAHQHHGGATLPQFAQGMEQARLGIAVQAAVGPARVAPVGAGHALGDAAAALEVELVHVLGDVVEQRRAGLAAHRALEEALADWLGYPRALLFISGFAANQALIAALVEKDDRIVADRLSHASLLEAASLSPAQLRRFTHNDPQQLAHALLAQYQGIILLAKLNDSGVAHLAPALHAFVDGYLAIP